MEPRQKVFKGKTMKLFQQTLETVLWRQRHSHGKLPFAKGKVVKLVQQTLKTVLHRQD